MLLPTFIAYLALMNMIIQKEVYLKVLYQAMENKNYE